MYAPLRKAGYIACVLVVAVLLLVAAAGIARLLGVWTP